MIQLQIEKPTEVRNLMQCTTRQWQVIQSQVTAKVGEIIADLIEKQVESEDAWTLKETVTIIVGCFKYYLPIIIRG